MGQSSMVAEAFGDEASKHVRIKTTVVAVASVRLCPLTLVTLKPK